MIAGAIGKQYYAVEREREREHSFNSVRDKREHWKESKWKRGEERETRRKILFGNKRNTLLMVLIQVAIEKKKNCYSSTE